MSPEAVDVPGSPGDLDGGTVGADERGVDERGADERGVDERGADAAVQVRGLEVAYGQVLAVRGVELTARHGAVTAVLGRNGAGKTSTVECCVGLRRPTAGTVRVAGLDPAADRARLRLSVGVALQDGGLPTGSRVEELVRAVAAQHAHPVPVPALLEALDLATVGSRAVRRLSGGERQRLAVAVAVVGRPRVIFLDEPTAGLDPHARLAVWALIERLRDAGVAVVLTTHAMDEAERLADHVVVLDQGRVVAAGSPQDLVGGESGQVRFSAPAGLDLSGLALALPTGTRVREEGRGRYVVDGDLGPQAVATVTAWCAAQDVAPDRLAMGRRTLEDAFLDLTGRPGQTGRPGNSAPSNDVGGPRG